MVANTTSDAHPPKGQRPQPETRALGSRPATSSRARPVPSAGAEPALNQPKGPTRSPKLGTGNSKRGARIRAIAGTFALVAMLVVIWLTSPAIAEPPVSVAAPAPQASEVMEGKILAVEWIGPAVAADMAGAPSTVQSGFVSPEMPAAAGTRVFTVRLTTGSQAGRDVQVVMPEGGAMSLAAAARRYNAGDSVVVSYMPARLDDTPSFVLPSGGDEAGTYQLIDHLRWPWLIWGALLFGAGIAVVAGGQGLRALVGLGSAILVLWWFIVPRVLSGAPPVPVALIGCALIAIPSLLLTHGVGRHGLVPLLGMGGSLLLVGALTGGAVRVAELTGFAASEDISLLYAGTGGRIDPQGLLLAGMLIGVVGGLVDVTVGQAAAVFEFHAVDPHASRLALFRRGMNVGRAHVAAAVHTLVLAYTGAGLPLLLLFALYASHLDMVWNSEMIVAEAVRTFAGSLGLAAAMPLTTWLACLACRPRRRRLSLPPTLDS